MKGRISGGIFCSEARTMDQAALRACWWLLSIWGMHVGWCGRTNDAALGWRRGYWNACGPWQFTSPHPHQTKPHPKDGSGRRQSSRSSAYWSSIRALECWRSRNSWAYTYPQPCTCAPTIEEPFLPFVASMHVFDECVYARPKSYEPKWRHGDRDRKPAFYGGCARAI